MKTQLFITIWIATIALAVFFGLSNLEITQMQHQTSNQQQVQRQDNLQLVFMDTRMKITNVNWEIKSFAERKIFINWMNSELDFYQQLNLKIQGHNFCQITVYYPVFNKKKEVYTNENVNVNYNSNTIKLNAFGKLK